SIIALLASVVLLSLNNARVKARDAKRATDAQQMAKAVALFYDDHGYYPSSTTPESTYSALGNGDWSPAFKQEMSPYASSLPKDPLNDDTYYYTYLKWPSFPATGIAAICGGHYVLLMQ